MVETLAQTTRIIRGRMGQLGMTQKDLSDRLGIKQSTFSKKMTGTSPFEPEELAKLSLYLEYPPLMDLAQQLGYEVSPQLADEVAQQEVKLASTVLQKALQRLPSRERQFFLLFSSLVLGGLAPDEVTKESRMLRILSRFDLASQEYEG